jgi:hypothetical protein
MKMNMKWPFSFALRFNQKLHSQSMAIIGIFYGVILLPFLILFIVTSRKMEKLSGLEDSVHHLPIRLEKVKRGQRDKNIFRQTYGSVDPYYIDHVLEKMVFLKPEVEALELVYHHPAFKSCENVQKRLETLTKKGNHLMFSEKHREASSELEEIYLSQIRPVEINGDDLKTILRAVEGVSIGDEAPPNHRPQFVIREFHLSKKKLAERETYLLEMQLIKRGHMQ